MSRKGTAAYKALRHVKLEPIIKGYALQPNAVWNPLIKLPRNAPCPCKSGKKFKRCHLPLMPRAFLKPDPTPEKK